MLRSFPLFSFARCYSSSSLSTLSYCYLGRVPYMKAYDLQCTTVEQVRQGNLKNTVYFVEHPHVYTAGRRIKGTPSHEVQRLNNLGAEYYEVQRGGQLTYHGPGQLVGYPILNLSDFDVSVKDFVCMLEKSLIDVCDNYGIKGTTSPHTGVWVNNKKIAALGLQIQHHITMHGFALNVSPDLSFFNYIIPCGLPDKKATSILAETNQKPTFNQVISNFLSSFGKRLHVDWVDLETSHPEFYKKHVSPLISHSSTSTS